MKIIDKNKDYYDFLMGVYGQDPKAVYDRRGSAILHKDRTPEPLRKLAADSPIYIDGLLNILAGRMMHVFTFTNRPGGITYEETNCYEVNRESSVPLRIRLEWKAYPFPKEHINTCRWRMTAFPIRHPSGEVTHEDEWFFTGKDTWDYKFASYDNPILISASLLLIPAETIFDEIQAFILSLNDIQHEDTRTDIQKLESAGFDRKTSFRKM